MKSLVNVWKPALSARPQDAPDILDSDLRTPGSIEDAQNAVSRSAREWNIVTTIQTEDFVQALRAAHEAG